ncbi:MAG: signal peptidase II [Lachnospiraceae bacterium]|nr:signal peptidase II [Lachnospiraceae bacterium]
MKKIVAYVLGAVGLLGVDLLTKYLAQTYLGDRVIPILGDFLELRYIVNDGLSFSSFSGMTAVTMSVPVIVMIVWIGVWIYFLKFLKKRNEMKAITAVNICGILLTAGFMGNYIERILNGGVTDFIHVKGFAIFNVADIYVTMCQGILLIFVVYMCKIEYKEKKAKKEEEKLS